MKRFKKFAALSAIFACLFFHWRFCIIAFYETCHLEAVGFSADAPQTADKGVKLKKIAPPDKLIRRNPYPKAKDVIVPLDLTPELLSAPAFFVARSPYLAGTQPLFTALRSPPLS